MESAGDTEEAWRRAEYLAMRDYRGARQAANRGPCSAWQGTNRVATPTASRTKRAAPPFPEEPPW